jgi:hypothetical protein
MAILLVDAKVYKVKDMDALRGLSYTTTTALRSISDNSYLPVEDAVELIRGKRFIRRRRKEFGINPNPKTGHSYEEEEIIVGLSNDVHEALGWHVEAFDNMEKELDGLRNTNYSINRKLSTVKSKCGKYEVALLKYNNLTFWSKLCKVFKGDMI